MAPERRALLANLAALAAALNEAQVERLAGALGTGTLTLAAGALTLQQLGGLPTDRLPTVVGLLRAWAAAGGTPGELAVALRAAQLAHVAAVAAAPQTQLAWTGPADTRAAARTTLGALLEVIDTARQEIVVVGYAITEGAAPVFARLADARRRGAHVVLIGDRIAERLPTLRALWPLPQLPTLYTRPADPDDPMSALHAKLAIADGERLLVTSANLTYHGLAGNIEVGVVICGTVAREAQGLLRGLITSGTLVPVTPSRDG